MPVEDREEEALHAVGDQPRLEAAAEEADEAVLLDDVAHHLGVGDHVRKRLPRRLYHPELNPGTPHSGKDNGHGTSCNQVYDRNLNEVILFLPAAKLRRSTNGTFHLLLLLLLNKVQKFAPGGLKLHKNM